MKLKKKIKQEWVLSKCGKNVIKKDKLFVTINIALNWKLEDYHKLYIEGNDNKIQKLYSYIFYMFYM